MRFYIFWCTQNEFCVLESDDIIVKSPRKKNPFCVSTPHIPIITLLCLSDTRYTSLRISYSSHLRYSHDTTATIKPSLSCIASWNRRLRRVYNNYNNYYYYFFACRSALLGVLHTRNRHHTNTHARTHARCLTICPCLSTLGFVVFSVF